ncbi:MAG: hypothetical protein KDC66_10075 [Phaeodactylibacter sp.]|nr:hypothetical protein [Phaeodactylibacter sp.]MCB9272582.1 hypothetical protein [Lewinellaceae bacterium]
MKRLTLLSAVLIVLVLAACQRFDELDGIDSADYDAEYALPLLNSSLSIKDALEEFEDLSTIIIDADGVIHFTYKGDVITQNSDTIFKRINETLSGVPIFVNSKRMALPLEFPDGLSFDKLVFKEGKFRWSFQHKHPDPVSFEITMPQLTKDGQPLSFTASLPGYSGTGTPPTYLLSLASPTDLAGYEVIPDPVTDSIYVEYELTRSNGQPDTASLVGIAFDSLRFSYMEGYLGVQEHKGGRDTIVIDFFDNWVRGDIYFEDPTVVFNIENSFGIPTESRVKVFEVFTVRGDILPLESQYVTDGISFPYPSIDEVGEIKRENFVFNKQNSNIDVILGAGPLAIDYDVDAVTNPDSNTTIRGFITDSSYYRVRVEVDLPLYGKSFDFIGRDTFDIEFTDYENVHNAEFKLVTVNGLPLDVGVQGYFLDESGAVLDSLFATRQRVIESAAVNGEGVATAPTEDVTYIDYPDARFDRVRPARRLAIVASFSTVNEGQQSVKILAEQAVQVKLGVILGVRD